jgi:hypothetical protein
LKTLNREFLCCVLLMPGALSLSFSAVARVIAFLTSARVKVTGRRHVSTMYMVRRDSEGWVLTLWLASGGTPGDGVGVLNVPSGQFDSVLGKVEEVSSSLDKVAIPCG